MRRRLIPAVAVGLAFGLAALTGCTAGETSNDKSTKDLEVVSWWTSGSEERALGALFAAYQQAHPGVTVTNATVAGGGGSNASVVLAQRLLAGDPPDVYQTFPGAALRSYVAQNQMSDVSAVIQSSGMAANLPQTLLDGLTVGGKQYGVPTSSHRGNMLFYNKALLAKAQIAAPAAGYSAETFAADLDKLDDAGVVPLCLGAKDRFTTAALFENVLLGVVGTQGWSQILADRFDWNGPQTREALSRFAGLLDHADPAAGGLSWDQATEKLAKGGCAFETLNDSAFGELVDAGAVDGRDFGRLPYPGTDGAYVAVVDTFVRARQAENGRNAVDYLAVIAAPETQLAFSRIKGSVPVRTDADVSTLTPYQQSAAEAFRTLPLLWSITHGEAMSPAFQTGYYDAVDTFVRSRDAKAFSATLTEAMGRAAPPK